MNAQTGPNLGAHSRKLTPEQVAWARQSWRDGAPLSRIRATLGLGDYTTRSAIYGTNYAWLPDAVTMEERDARYRSDW
jgi:hypothetical protein